MAATAESIAQGSATKSGTAPKNAAWTANPGSQTIFLNCPIFECLLEGNRGGGKTDALIMDFAQHVGVGWGPEWQGILFRQTYKQLKDVVKKTKKWFPRIFGKGAVFNKVDYEWTFPDGETLLLRHMRDPSDYWNYHGHAYPWIAFEELTTWATDACYKVMMSCSRSTVDPDRRDTYGRPMPRKYRSTTNPYGRGHNWVKKRFRLPRARGLVIRDSLDMAGNTEPERVALHSSFKENLPLVAAEPNYQQKIAAAADNPAQYAAWMDGSWDITAGGMFDDIWDANIHIIQPFPIPKSWKIRRTLDWGDSAPFSLGWWAISDGCDVMTPEGIRNTVRGDRFRIDEWYGSRGGENKGLGLTGTQVSRGIVSREIKMGLRDKHSGVPIQISPGPADTQIWSTPAGQGRSTRGNTIAKMMAKPVTIKGRRMPGCTFLKADKRSGSRKAGLQAIRQHLLDAIPPELRSPPEEGVRTAPGIFIFAHCGWWIELVPPAPRSDDDMDDIDKLYEDHNIDETRYEVYRPVRKRKRGRQIGMC